MFTSASGRCSFETVPSARGMPWSNSIMSCWIMPSQRGSGYFPEPARRFDPLQRRALRHIGVGAVQAGLLVVPQDEADGALGLHVRRGEHPGELHDQRGARTVVVRRLAPAVPVHVARRRCTSPRDASCRPWCNTPPRGGRARSAACRAPAASRRAGASGSVFTPVGARLPRRRPPPTARVRAGRFGRPARLRLLVGRVAVVQALGVRAAVALELRLDPVDGRAIAVGALAAVAELGEPLDRRLVALEIETCRPESRWDRPASAALSLGSLRKRRRQRGGRRERAGKARGDEVEAHGEC